MAKPRKPTKPTTPTQPDELPVVAINQDDVEAMVAVRVVVANGFVYATGESWTRGRYADQSEVLTLTARPFIRALMEAIGQQLGCRVYDLYDKVERITPRAPGRPVGRA